MSELRAQVYELRRLLGWDHNGPAPVVVEAVSPQDLAAFFTSAYTALSTLKGRTYETGVPGAVLALDTVFKPMRDPLSDGVEFVAALDVRYDGKTAPENWAEAEKALEKDVTDAIVGMAADAMGGAEIRLTSRTKADPYPNDPKSMTMLRFKMG
jgi:hypothetical protein